MANKNFSAVLKKLYPNAKFTLRDDSDGKGVYIATWEDAAPKPELSELASEAIAAEGLIVAAKNGQRDLKDTDAQVLQALELGEAIPANIVAKRAAARAAIAAAKSNGHAV